MKKLLLVLIFVPVFTFGQDTVKMNRQELSGLYLHKAGGNITAGAIFMGLGMATAIIPVLSTDMVSGAKTALGVTAGLMTLVAIVELGIGGGQLRKAGMISQGKKYKVFYTGNKITVTF